MLRLDRASLDSRAGLATAEQARPGAAGWERSGSLPSAGPELLHSPPAIGAGSVTVLTVRYSLDSKRRAGPMKR